MQAETDDPIFSFFFGGGGGGIGSCSSIVVLNTDRSLIFYLHTIEEFKIELMVSGWTRSPLTSQTVRFRTFLPESS